MIKIESLTGTATINRNGEECVLFVGMVVDLPELDTLKADGVVVYCVDEGELITVGNAEKTAAPKTTKPVAPEGATAG